MRVGHKGGACNVLYRIVRVARAETTSTFAPAGWGERDFDTARNHQAHGVVPCPYLQYSGSSAQTDPRLPVPEEEDRRGSRPDDGLLRVQPPLLIDFTTLSHKPNPHKRETTPPPLLRPRQPRTVHPPNRGDWHPFQTLCCFLGVEGVVDFNPLSTSRSAILDFGLFTRQYLFCTPQLGPEPDRPPNKHKRAERKQRQKRGTTDTSNKEEEVQDSNFGNWLQPICAFKRTIDNNPRIQ